MIFMLDLVFLLHLVGCWVWPFVFVFNFSNAIRLDKEEKSPTGMSRTASLIWAGVALAMMVGIPFWHQFYS